MANNSGGSMMAGFLVGTMVGAGVALILAPKAGEETRRQLGEAARKLKDGTAQRADEMKGVLKDGASRLGSAIDAGKDAFRRDTEPSPIGKEHV